MNTSTVILENLKWFNGILLHSLSIHNNEHT
jgi:hypothetical protein